MIKSNGALTHVSLSLVVILLFFLLFSRLLVHMGIFFVVFWLFVLQSVFYNRSCAISAGLYNDLRPFI